MVSFYIITVIILWVDISFWRLPYSFIDCIENVPYFSTDDYKKLCFNMPNLYVQ